MKGRWCGFVVLFALGLLASACTGGEEGAQQGDDEPGAATIDLWIFDG